ncbi:MAG TPA: hypothetical protein VH951_02405, partial [Dehalococcoidia bacterium]
ALFYVAFFRHEQSTLAQGGVYGVDSSALSNLWHYLKWLVLPFGQQPDHDLARSALALVFVVSGPAFLARDKRVPAFLWFWTLVALLPLAFLNATLDPRYTYLACVPLSLYVIAVAKLALESLRLNGRAVGFALGAAVAVVAPLLALEVHSDQAPWHQEARNYQAIYYQIPRACGVVPEGSRIYIVNSPAFDWLGLGSQLALNFSYDQVTVLRFGELSGVPRPLGAGDCIVVYDGTRYVRAQ